MFIGFKPFSVNNFFKGWGVKRKKRQVQNLTIFIVKALFLVFVSYKIKFLPCQASLKVHISISPPKLG